MRISRLLAGQLPHFRFKVNPIPGLPPAPRPLSATQVEMNFERDRIARLPADTSLPSRQTRRARARTLAKLKRSNVTKLARGKPSRASADWRTYLTA